MRPKAKTIQERFGFRDGELGTPKHDELMVWIGDNLDKVLGSDFKSEWTDKEMEDWKKHTDRPLPKYTEVGKTETKKTWEFPVVDFGDGGYMKDQIVGFVDMVCCVTSFKRLMWIDDGGEKKAVMVEYRGGDYWIEAKTSIKSVGELIRQLRFYQKYANIRDRLCQKQNKCDKIIVVSPDDKYADLIREQGFGFVKAYDK